MAPTESLRFSFFLKGLLHDLPVVSTYIGFPRSRILHFESRIGYACHYSYRGKGSLCWFSTTDYAAFFFR